VTPRLGLSSSSCPRASARELVELAGRLGASCVDLRAGRGQGWEDDAEAVLDALPVAFLGVDGVLGAGLDPSTGTPERTAAAVERSIPVRVFVCDLADPAAAAAVAADAARLRARWGDGLRLAVETHAASPALAPLARVLEAEGIAAVVDTLGLARVGADLAAARAFLREHAVAVQVKGFERTAGGYRHVPLRRAVAVARWTVSLVADSALPVTVETKAGSAADDLAVLREAFAAGTDDLADPASSLDALACA
jgi:hypothetical protein